jgi:molybdate transport system substrate-binding protein
MAQSNWARTGKLLLLGWLAVYCTACGKPAPPPTATPTTSAPASPTTPAEALKKEITVSIAASAKDVVEELAKAYTEKSGVAVRVNAGASSILANQILEGAPAGLFLSANRQWADKIADAKLTRKSMDLLTNTLVIVVPADNPAAVAEPKDLLKPEVKNLALAGEKVPAGIYADEVLTKLELMKPLVEANKIVRGQDVRNTLTFVERGEAEAGIVYSTDALIAKDVKVIHHFDPSLHEKIVYVLVLLNPHESQADAAPFFEFLQSDQATTAFEKAGFQRVR